MSDQHDLQTAQDYDRLRDVVVATTDVEASLDDLHDRVGAGRSGRRRWVGVVGAAAGLALVAGAAFVFTRSGSTDVTAAADPAVAGDPAEPSAPASSTPDDTAASPSVTDDCRVNTFIYLVPEASAEQVQGMRSTLESLDLEPYEFLDRDATAQEFRRLFADHPDFVDAVDPSELPQSFRLPESLPAQTITAIEGTPGVLRIESSDAACAPNDPASADRATTTTIAGG
jgi:hypothetical protein